VTAIRDKFWIAELGDAQGSRKQIAANHPSNNRLFGRNRSGI
jgi:hypothetical protein